MIDYIDQANRHTTNPETWQDMHDMPGRAGRNQTATVFGKKCHFPSCFELLREGKEKTDEGGSPPALRRRPSGSC
jgi:hypothetical protein